MAEKFLGHILGALNTELHYDTTTDALITNRVQNVAPILEQNRRERNEFDGRYGDYTKVAEIPNIVIEKMMKEGIWEAFASGDESVMNRWLKDSDNRKFLTAHQSF